MSVLELKCMKCVDSFLYVLCCIRDVLMVESQTMN